MLAQEGKRFRRSLIGYDRTSVDSEFERLIEQAEAFSGERQELQDQISELNKENTSFSRTQIQLNTQLASISGRVAELETSLSQARSENAALESQIKAHTAERSAMQRDVDQLRDRDQDYSRREREFAELQSSVSSIMSVTKRATDRLFQKAVESQEAVAEIAGDAAREVAEIRSDMNEVRQKLNAALDEVQDHIDRVDASLTGAVHKLIAIKHDDGLHTAEEQPDILTEVERLLSVRPGEIDRSDGKPYSAPSIGPYGAKFLTDSAKQVDDARRVAAGKVSDKRQPRAEGVSVRRVNSTRFESTPDSTREAAKLLERGGQTASEHYYGSSPRRPETAAERPRPNVIPMGFTAPAPQEDDPAQTQGYYPDQDFDQGQSFDQAQGFDPSFDPNQGFETTEGGFGVPFEGQPYADQYAPQDDGQYDAADEPVYVPDFSDAPADFGGYEAGSDAADDQWNGAIPMGPADPDSFSASPVFTTPDEDYGSADFPSGDPNGFLGNSGAYNYAPTYVGDRFDGSASSGHSFEYYPVRNYSYRSTGSQRRSYSETTRGTAYTTPSEPARADVTARRGGSRAPKRVTVHVIRGGRK